MAAPETNGDGHEGEDALLLALARGLSVAKAARACKVSESTVHRRLRDGEFKAKVEQLRRQLLDVAVRRLSDLMLAAADKLAKLLRSRNEAISLGAARTVLQYGLDSHGVLDLQGRIDRLEQAAEEQRANGRRW